MKTRIINLVGASGTGKTYIAKKLSELDNINVIQSYTTRPPRHENEWGHTFLDLNKWYPSYRKDTFVGIENDGDPELTDREVSHLWGKEDYVYIDIDDMIAYFNSYNSGHHYFATDEQVVRGKTNIYVVDPEGAKQVHKFYEDTDVEVITIGIYEDKETRLDRMRERYYKDKELTEEDLILDSTWHMMATMESIKRIDKDEELFKVIKCDYMIKGSDNALKFIKELIE